MNYVDRYLVFGILPKIKDYFNLSNSQAGLLQTVFLITYIGCSFWFGAIGDKISRKYIIFGGTVLWSVFSFVGSLASRDHYIWFYVCRSFVGVGEASISTLGFTIIGDLYTGTARTRCLSIFLAAMPLGSGIGYLIGPQIIAFMDSQGINSDNSWKWAFRFTPEIGIILAFLLFFIMIEPKRGQAEVEERDTDNQSTSTNYSPLDIQIFPTQSILWKLYYKNLHYFYLRKSFITTSLGYSSVSFVFGGLAVWIPIYIEYINTHFQSAKGHLSNEKAIGLMFGIATGATGLFGVIIGGEITAFLRTKDRPIELYICIICCVLSSISLFFTIFFSLISLLTTWVFLFSTFLFLSLMWSPNGDLLMQIIGPLHRSKATAIQIVCIHALGDAISPFIIGLISDYLKIDDSLWSNLKALYNTLYIAPCFLVVAASFYIISLFYYRYDYESTIDETTKLFKERRVYSNSQRIVAS